MASVDTHTHVCARRHHAHTHTYAVFLDMLFSYVFPIGSDVDPMRIRRTSHVSDMRIRSDPIGSDHGSDDLTYFLYGICKFPGALIILLLKHRRSQEVPREGFLEL